MSHYDWSDLRPASSEGLDDPSPRTFSGVPSPGPDGPREGTVRSIRVVQPPVCRSVDRFVSVDTYVGVKRKEKGNLPQRQRSEDRGEQTKVLQRRSRPRWGCRQGARRSHRPLVPCGGFQVDGELHTRRETQTAPGHGRREGGRTRLDRCTPKASQKGTQ